MEATAPAEEKRLGGGRLSAQPLLAILVLFGLIAAGYFAWWGLRTSGGNGITLQDGTHVALAGVTYGTTHEFDPLPPLLRARRWLKIPQQLPDVATVTSSQPETRMWLRTKEGSSRGPHRDTFVYFEDEHGCPFEEGEPAGHFGSPGNDLWISVRPSPPIADGQAFDFCAFDREARIEVVRFHVDTMATPPALQVKQALTPRALPQTVGGKGLRATLLSLVAVSAPDQPHYRARIRAADAGGAAWSPVSLAAEDQYGRSLKPLAAYDRKQLVGEGFPFTGLCRREPAWKLVTTLAPEPGAGASPDLTWNLRAAALSGQASPARKGELSLSVSKLDFPPGVVEKVGKSYRVATLRVTASERAASSRLVLKRIDGKDARRLADSLVSSLPKGREPVLSVDLAPEGGWSGDLTIPVPARAKSVDLEFAEYAGRKVEFVVAPPMPR